MNSGTETLESMSQAPGYNKWLLRKFSKYLQGEILEIGSGIGNFSKLLTKFGSVTATDIDHDYISKLNSIPTISAGLGDVEKGKFFFKNKRFDSVICLNVLEHIKEDEAALKNLHYLLKIKGHLILIVPGHQSLYGTIDKSIDHFRRYDKRNLEKRLRKLGFKVLKSRRLNFLGGVGWFIAGKIFKQNRVRRGNIRIFNILSPIFLFFENFFEPPLGTSIFIVARRSK